MIRPVPARLTKRVTEMGGRADNGLPLFRVMRSCDRFTWIGGDWQHYDAHGNHTGSHVGMDRVLKYPEIKDRYIFEFLTPPEDSGTPESWRERFTKLIGGQFIDTMGPFPREGEYELFPKHGIIEQLTLDKQGNIIRRDFVELTATICDALVETARLNVSLPANVKIAIAREQREKEEKAKDQRLIDKINNMGLAFEGKSFVTVPTGKEVSRYG